MDNLDNTVNEVQKSSTDDDPIIFKSRVHELASKVQVPDVTIPEFLFGMLEKNSGEYKDGTWVMDIIKGTSYKYSDIKPLSTKFASAITRLGFKKGDVLFYVTYDMALIFIIQIGVWMCGGTVRGCFQKENKEEYLRQMEEISATFILCDPETEQSVKWAAERLSGQKQLLSIGGEVEGATAVEGLIDNDDGSAFPHDMKINPKEDIAAIYNTSGSTGLPKGAVHTHYNIVALTCVRAQLGKSLEFFAINSGYSCRQYAWKTSVWKRSLGKSLMASLANYLVGALFNLCGSITHGYRCLNVSKFDQKSYLRYVLMHKPETLFIYPYVANWFAKILESESEDFSFIKNIFCGGSVLDIGTCKLLEERLPQMKISQSYGMSECLLITSTDQAICSKDSIKDEGIVAGLITKKMNNEQYVSCGLLLPLVELKILDSDHGCSVGSNINGNLWLRAPYLMKGYAKRIADKGYVSVVDEDGWLNTGDIGFIDEEGNLFIVDRQSSFFKYYMHHISPVELEAVVAEHPAVLSVAVVGVPNPETTSAARAYVVLKPNCNATEEDIKQFVAERKVFYKQLHGGVVFLNSLPKNRGGKIDKYALLRKAIEE